MPFILISKEVFQIYTEKLLFFGKLIMFDWNRQRNRINLSLDLCEKVLDDFSNLYFIEVGGYHDGYRVV